MNTIRIVFPESKWALNTVSRILLSLDDEEIEYSPSYVSDCSYLRAAKELDANTADIFVLPLSKVPILNSQEKLVIGALSERSNSGNTLLLNERGYAPQEDLRLQKGSHIVVQSLLQKKQLLYLRNDVHCTVIDQDNFDLSKILTDNQYDGVLLPTMFVEEEVFAELQVHRIDLHPKEWISSPGSGVLAFLVHAENIESRKIIQKIHHKATAEATNVERKCFILAMEHGLKEFGAYCYKDSMNFYHIVVCKADGDFQKRSISLSTTAKLHDLAIQSLFT